MKDFRKVLFALFLEGKPNTYILHVMKYVYRTKMSYSKVQEYRQLFEQLDSTSREKFINGKLDLMGKS